jgi:hypothetical protein
MTKPFAGKLMLNIAGARVMLAPAIFLPHVGPARKGRIRPFFGFCCDAKKGDEIDKLSVDVVRVHP